MTNLIAVLSVISAFLAVCDVVSTQVLVRWGYREGGIIWRKLPLTPDALLAAQIVLYAAGWSLLEWVAPPHPAVWIFPLVVQFYAVFNNGRILSR